MELNHNITEWRTLTLDDLTLKIGSGITPTGGSTVYKSEGRPFVRSQNIGWGNLKLSEIVFIEEIIHQTFPNTEIHLNDVFLNISGASIGRSSIANEFLVGGNVNQHVCIIRPNPNYLDSVFLRSYLLSEFGQKQIDSFQSGGNREGLNIGQIKIFQIFLPPLKEQKAIANALSDADVYISSLEELIQKKQNIKQAAMQKLLKPKKDWEVKTLGEVVDVLDNLRVPLNDNQRNLMKGDIPYCGANGIVDYVDDFVIDDEIILIAEDGGYFDEYKNRPIAYKMAGKCWVNNHAHILKAKVDFSQDYLFYSIVNKNILNFIVGGTRAKLNKSSLLKIEIFTPPTLEEQTQIATILSDMDNELEILEEKLQKAEQLKQGMMQNLLTGKIRLL
ncbi:restriction endonuclease subunit S [Bernardetia sp. ABR2-2B]|uniref:restriction endonuclease subunit S n=1 Tax=Bernardetia sp. ABR2-2B TaxID=3127472 RepID=UPI0030D22054